jgi:hypothetical protein
MSPAIMKFALMFVCGLALGLVMPWGYGPAKPNEDGRNPADRTVTVRCIIEYRAPGAGPNGFVGGKLPPIEAPMPIPGRPQPPVEVRLQNAGKPPSGADEIILNFFVNPCWSGVEPGNPAQQRPMPEAI